ncbi:hypothetical protein B0H11DRAFT_1905986 [Mycena galericulata]|nr:hypothetical protein B0H11DRAFT_1905986 [Mycena galericulata]
MAKGGNWGRGGRKERERKEEGKGDGGGRKGPRHRRRARIKRLIDQSEFEILVASHPRSSLFLRLYPAIFAACSLVASPTGSLPPLNSKMVLTELRGDIQGTTLTLHISVCPRLPISIPHGDKPRRLRNIRSDSARRLNILPKAALVCAVQIWVALTAKLLAGTSVPMYSPDISLYAASPMTCRTIHVLTTLSLPQNTWRLSMPMRPALDSWGAENEVAGRGRRRELRNGWYPVRAEVII